MHVAVLILTLVVLFAASPVQAAPRPNLVVVMTDDQTVADLEAMPLTRRLVGDAGATFTSAYASYPLCCPSRATFLTGRYAHNHGVRTNTPPAGGVEALDARRTLPVWLQDAGYETSHVGKYLNGYGLRRAPDVPPGWSDWHGLIDKSTYAMWGYRMWENGVQRTYGTFRDEDPALYQTDVLRDTALDFVRAQAREDDRDPFLLSLAFVAPHGEVVPPGSTTSPYLRSAPRHRGRFATLPVTSAAYDEADVGDKPPHIRALRRLGPRARARIERDLRARRESLLAVDEAVAALIGELERTGLADSTYVVVTSDNGFLQGEHRLAKGKYFPYEPASHVPLLVRGPGIPAGTVSDELVVNADLAPTLLDAAGVRAGAPLDGRSLLPFARDGARRTARPLLHEGLVGGDADRDGATGAQDRPRAGAYVAIRTRRYLYVKWRGGARELYDRVLDPDELTSVHRDPRYATVRQALSDEAAWLRGCVAAECRGAFTLPPVRRRTIPTRPSGPGGRVR